MKEVDTLITGELKQQHFNYAQENKLNLYICGHYATETFGVDKLAQQVAKKFQSSIRIHRHTLPSLGFRELPF